jgi:hypothetical protein
MKWSHFIKLRDPVRRRLSECTSMEVSSDVRIVFHQLVFQLNRHYIAMYHLGGYHAEKNPSPCAQHVFKPCIFSPKKIPRVDSATSPRLSAPTSRPRRLYLSNPSSQASRNRKHQLTSHSPQDTNQLPHINTTTCANTYSCPVRCLYHTSNLVTSG